MSLLRCNCGWSVSHSAQMRLERISNPRTRFESGGQMQTSSSLINNSSCPNGVRMKRAKGQATSIDRSTEGDVFCCLLRLVAISEEQAPWYGG